MNPDSEHADQVAVLAERLFDELTALHGLASSEKEILSAAAHLHDIGWVEGRAQHHKNSMKRILAEPLHNWSSREILMIANVARYHRKALPNVRHENFSRLKNGERHVVEILASFLRLADGLDRSHDQIVQKLYADIHFDRVILSLNVSGDYSLEEDGLEKKKDLFTKVFSTQLIAKFRPLY